MQRHIMRAGVAVAASAALGTLGITEAGASGAAARAAQETRPPSAGAFHAAAVPGTQLWVKRYNGPANDFDSARSVAVSPTGDKVFVTGYSWGRTSKNDYATVAYSAATGARLWEARYNGPGNGYDVARSVAVSRSGRTVFVTGDSWARTSGDDYATVAYSAATGARLWVARYNGPANRHDVANSVAVSRSGRTVFVTGYSNGGIGHADSATVAYRAATGARLWVGHYSSPANKVDGATSMAVSRNGRTVFVTGYSSTASDYDYATVAYRAATGARLWAARYNSPANGDESARSVAVSRSGRTVFVTGYSWGRTSPEDYATVAYSAATGARLWVARYNGPANGFDSACSVAVSRSGRTVFVTGESSGRSSDYATVAYSAATGARLWVARYGGPGEDGARSMAVSPSGRTVFVTGYSVTASDYDYATVAYSAATGARLWAARYNGPANNFDEATSVAVSPGGRTVFVTGSSFGRTSSSDYATIAYHG